MKRIDLNADLGEGMPGEREILGLISTANLAGGGHAGGGAILEESVWLCRQLGVAVGAHPSYPDRENFGRISRLDHDRELLVRSLIEQIIAVAEVLDEPLHHIKAHGALYNDAVVEQRAAYLLLEAIAGAEIALGYSGVPVMTMDRGVLADVARSEGRAVITEAFADRAYDSAGRLVPRSMPGAVLDSTEDIVLRTLRVLESGNLPASDGSSVEIAAQSICIHGDNAHAVEVAYALSSGLKRAGFEIRAV